MSDFKGTPGTWKQHGRYGKIMTEIGNGEKAICTVWTKIAGNRKDGGELITVDEEGEANAKLITAAPDLLEACQAMMDAPGGGEENGNTPRAKALRQLAYDKISQAIKKATT